MNRNSIRLRGIVRKGFAARLGLAAALAGGMIAAGIALPAPAFAKEKEKKEEKEGNSKGFAEAYQPLADIVNAPAGDYAAAKAQLPTVIAAIENQTDRFAMGNLILALGNKSNDTGLQDQGIRMILDSGKADPAMIGQMHYYLGRWAYEAKNFAEARAQFEQASAGGFAQGEPDALIADTYFGEDRDAEGLQYLAALIDKRRAAGQAVPNNWVLRGLKVAYDAELADQVNQFAAMLVSNNPSKDNWVNALQVVYAVNPLDTQAQLDLLRLMRTTGSLQQRREYVDYIEAADPRRMPNEVLAVLEVGKQAGIFSDSDAYYKEVKAQATPRAEADRKEAQTLVAEARSAATGITAQGVGDQFFSFGSYEQAADMYQVALDKGVRDREMILTRLGIAQAGTGKVDEARATFRQIAGPREPIARMWLTYLDTPAG